jgi:adenine-specific DNA-methyltransferase
MKKNSMNKLINDSRILWPDSEDGRPRRKVFLSEVSNELPNYTSIIGEKIYTRNGTKEIDELFGQKFFDFPKPSKLISDLIEQGCQESETEDIVLDFFSGSCTTAHAVMALNAVDGIKRKCISVQLPEKANENSLAYKAGFKTIADIAKERIKRVGKKIQEENPDFNGDLGFKVLKLSDSNFKQWQQITGKDKQALEEQMKLFVDPVAKNATTENMVYELLLKSGKDLNSTIEAKDGLRNQRNRTCFDIGKSQPRHHRCSNCQQATKSNCLRQTF